MQNDAWRVYEACPIFSGCFPRQEERTITFPKGPKPCRVMFVGQAPSFDKHLSKRRPALDCTEGSRAARLLCDMLRELNYDPSHFYFTNLVKCSSLNPRKEGSRTNCYEFFQKEIKEAKPKRIVALGRKVESFLKKKEIDIPVYFSYHPAYLLRNAITREKYSQQLKSAIEQLHR
jgi:uracil-DNA glycosylase family 4